MLHEILANGTWYQVTDPNTYDMWGQKCFKANKQGIMHSTGSGFNESRKLSFFKCKKPTFIPCSLIQIVEIKK